jgi:DNA polymerase-3 subunit epsilon
MTDLTPTLPDPEIAAPAETDDRQPVYVVFDTETTGLFQFKDKATGEPIPADAPGQPRMASCAFIECDITGAPIAEKKFFVAPQGWTMAEFDAIAIADGKTPASEINGLTDEFLNEHGQAVAVVLDQWNAYVDAGMAFCAFNAQFDQKMMRAELRRAGLPDRFEETRNSCLMRSLAPYGKEGLMIQRGLVKLAVACVHFGIVNDEAHDAMGDARAAQKLLEILLRDGRLIEPKVHYAAVPPKKAENPSTNGS